MKNRKSAVIGAGNVVTKDVLLYIMVARNPAVVLKEIEEK